MPLFVSKKPSLDISAPTPNNTIIAKNDSKTQLSSPKGDFEQTPDEILHLIFLFLDLKSLGRFARTNRTFRDLLNQSTIRISVKICDQVCQGTYPELVSKYKNFLVASSKRQNEKEEIERIKKEIFQQNLESQQPATQGSPNDCNCISREEKTATACCFVFGFIGGSLFSCCLPIDFFIAALIGTGITTPIPLIISRTGKCICNACQECKANDLEERENNLDTNFPDPKLMLK